MISVQNGNGMKAITQRGKLIKFHYEKQNQNYVKINSKVQGPKRWAVEIVQSLAPPLDTFFRNLNFIYILKSTRNYTSQKMQYIAV